MSIKLGYEAIEFAIKKYLMKQAEGIASIPGQSLNNKIKLLVDKYATQIRMSGKDVNKVTVKEVENEITYGLALKKQQKPKVISQGHPEFQGITEKLLGKNAKVHPFTGAGKLRIQQDVDGIIKNLKSMEPMDGLKEANSVIGRKGNYRHLSNDEAERIIAETEDHIFQRDIKPDLDDFASGGVAGQLHLNRPGFKRGKITRKETQKYGFRPDMPTQEMTYPYQDTTEEQFKKQNPKVYAQLKKDPVFNWKEFQKVGWSVPGETRIAIRKEGKGKEPGWGYTTRHGNIGINYLPFGKEETIGGESILDTDKVSTILHEMRHKKFKDSNKNYQFWKSKAVPEWVRKENRRNYDYAPSGGYIGGTEGQQIGLRGKPHWEKTAYDLTEEELYNRFLDQRVLPSRSKEHMAGSDFKPYFDKILRDKWEPHAKAYDEYLRTEKLPNPRGMRQYKYLAKGGIAGQLNRPGYAQGIGPVGEGQYSPTKGKDWIQTMPMIDPVLRKLMEEYRKRKGLAEILGV